MASNNLGESNNVMNEDQGHSCVSHSEIGDTHDTSGSRSSETLTRVDTISRSVETELESNPKSNLCNEPAAEDSNKQNDSEKDVAVNPDLLSSNVDTPEEHKDTESNKKDDISVQNGILENFSIETSEITNTSVLSDNLEKSSFMTKLDDYKDDESRVKCDDADSNSDQDQGGSVCPLPKEHVPLDYLLSQIPRKAQRGMLHQIDLVLTTIAANSDYIALGSNVGTVFLYNRKKQYMDRFRSENSADSVTSIKLHHGIDHQLAAGMSSGSVYILQIPATSTIGHTKQIQKFSVKDVHKTAVTCVEWSTNGMKLFSGDTTGTVLCTEVDFYEAQCKSVILLIEDSEIVQLHHCHKILLVSSKKRSVVCRTDENDQLFQIGQKGRKVPGRFGACFQPGLCKTDDAQLYATRPGYRVWKSSVDGIVNTTYLYKDLLNSPHPEICVLPFQNRATVKNQNQQFELLLMYLERYLLTWNENCLFLFNPENNSVIGTQSKVGCIVDVCCVDDEIFLLRRDCDRLVIRLAERSENIVYKDLDHILNTFSHPVTSAQESQSSMPSVFQAFGTNIFGKINFKDKRTPSPKRKSESYRTSDLIQETDTKTQESSTRGADTMQDMLPPVVKLTTGLLDIKVYTDDKSPEKVIHQQHSTSFVSDHENHRLSVSSQMSVDSVKDNLSICSTESENFSDGSAISKVGFDASVGIVPTIEEKLVEKLSKNEKVEDIVFSQRLKKTKKKKKMGKKDTEKITKGSPPKTDRGSVSSLGSSSSMGIPWSPDITENQPSLSRSPENTKLSPLMTEPGFNLKPDISETSEIVSHQLSLPDQSPKEKFEVKDISVDDDKKTEEICSPEEPDEVCVPQIDITTKHDEKDAELTSHSESDEVFSIENEENSTSEKDVMARESTKPTKGLHRSNTKKLHEILRNFGDTKIKKSDDIIEEEEKQSDTPEKPSVLFYKEQTTPTQPDKLSLLMKKTELEIERSLSRPRGNSDKDNSLPESEQLCDKSPSATSTLYKTPDSSSSGDDFYRKYREGSTCSSLVSSPDNPLMRESDDEDDRPNNYPQEESASGMESNIDIPPDLPPSKFINNWIEFTTQGNLYSLALSETHVWVADRSQNIYYSSFQGPGLIWRKASGLAKQIAVSKSGNIIWRLYKNIAYAGTKITPKHPEGLKWVEAVRECNYVAVGDNCAWYIKTNGEVLMQADLSKDRPCYKSQRVVCPFHLQQLVCRFGVVWGLTEDCKLIYRSGVTKENPAGTKWLLCKTLGQNLLFSHLALGDQKTGWAIDVVGQIWFVSGVTMETPLGDECWWQVPISEYYMQDVTAIDALRSLASKFDPQKLSYLLSTQRGGLIAAGTTGVWMCPEFKNLLHVCRGTMEGHHWAEVHLKGLALSVVWKTVCASTSSFENGVIWIQQPNGDIFTFPTNSCKFNSIARPSMREQFTCLSACKRSVWGLTESGKVYIRNGIWPHCPEGSSWVCLDLSQLGDVHLTHLSCGSLNVWAVDCDGVVFQRIGVMPPSSHSLNAAWLMVDSSPTGTVFNRVVTGSQDWMVWAIDNRRHVFVRDGVTDTMPIGTKWMHVPGTPATQLSISNNHVWALTPHGEIMCRYGITKKNLAGDYWKKIPGIFSQLSVSHLDSLWAIGREGNLYHRQTKYIVREDLSQDPLVSDKYPSRSSVGSDDGDWELV